MSQYVELMSMRKVALLKGNEQLASELYEAAMELEKAGLVTEEERLGAAYV